MRQTLRLIPQTIFILTLVLVAAAWIAPQPRITKVTIYPNPATEFISIDNDTNVQSLQILNLVGRRIKIIEDVVRDTPYDISDLPNGMYLVQIIDKQGKVLTTQRLSKR